jgi:HlyD family secretion protein
LPSESPRAIGSFASAVIEIERREGLTVPLSAVTTRRDVATVQVVENGTVRVREVGIGLIGEGRAELVSGVAQGDLVVARAGTFVRDGDVISPVPVN